MNDPGHSLAVCLADSLRLRCFALEQTLRQSGGPDLMLALLKDIRRLSTELKTAMDAEDALERIRHDVA
jgi:hypothetical protein